MKPDGSGGYETETVNVVNADGTSSQVVRYKTIDDDNGVYYNMWLDELAANSYSYGGIASVNRYNKALMASQLYDKAMGGEGLVEEERKYLEAIIGEAATAKIMRSSAMLRNTMVDEYTVTSGDRVGKFTIGTSLGDDGTTVYDFSS